MLYLYLSLSFALLHALPPLQPPARQEGGFGHVLESDKPLSVCNHLFTWVRGSSLPGDQLEPGRDAHCPMPTTNYSGPLSRKGYHHKRANKGQTTAFRAACRTGSFPWT